MEAVARSVAFQHKEKPRKASLSEANRKAFPGVGLAIDRTEILTCPVVRTFLFHAEGVPGGESKVFFHGETVKCDRDAEHGRECDEVVGADGDLLLAGLKKAYAFGQAIREGYPWYLLRLKIHGSLSSRTQKRSLRGLAAGGGVSNPWEIKKVHLLIEMTL